MKAHLLQRKFLHSIHQKSILFRIMLAIFAGVFLIVVISAFTFYQYEYSTTHEANFSLMQASVESISSSLSLIVSNNLAQKLYDLSHSSALRTILYYTEPVDTDISAVLASLNAISNSSIYISSIIFYDARHDIVLDSSYHQDTANDLYKNLINYYNKLSTDSANIEYNHTFFNLFHFEKEFYLATHFVGQVGQFYGTIIAKINIHYLYQMLFQQSSQNYDYFVYAMDGTAIFPDEVDYSLLHLSDSELNELLASEQSHFDQNGFTYFCYFSPATSWRFIVQIETSSLRPRAESVFRLFTPIFILVSIIGFLLSLIIIYVIYSPLKRMYDSVLSLSPDNITRSKNELSYITYAFSEMDTTIKQMEDTMNDISEDILDRIFTDLLNSTPLKYNYVKTSIQSIRSPYKFDGIYVSSAIQMQQDYTTEDQSNKVAPVQRIISALSAFNKQTESISFVKPMENGIIAVITSFEPTADIGIAHQVLDNMEVLVNGLLQQMGIPSMYARGHFYHSILDVTASYNRALDVLSKQREVSYIATQSKTSVAVTSAPALIVDQVLDAESKNNEAINYQIDCILDSITFSNSQDAYPILQNILNDLKQHKPFGDSTLRSICVFFKDFTEMLEKRALIKEMDIFHANLLVTESLSAQPQDEHRLCTEIEQFCTTLLDGAREQFKVNQNPYLLKAKKYIELHFSDSSLSLDKIAAECDITPNYLSKLFATSGTYYSEFTNQYRVKQSMSMLRETDLSVNEIAERCGFNSSQSYIRVFKKQFGLTPGNYRK